MEKYAKMSSNVKQLPCKVVDGHFIMIVKLLGLSGVVSYNAHTMKDLEAKNPYKPPPSMPKTMYSKAYLVDEFGTIFRCINSFPKRTSRGRDGFPVQHLLDALCGDGYVMSRDILYAITLVVNICLRGICLMSLA